MTFIAIYTLGAYLQYFAHIQQSDFLFDSTYFLTTQADPYTHDHCSSSRRDDTTLIQNDPKQNLPSKLSNYGERSLNLDQRGVYDQQTSKHDIVNLKPRENSQQINQYPWLTIENRDDVQYKRMNEQYNGKQTDRSTVEKSSPTRAAGRLTNNLQAKMLMDPQKDNRSYFTSTISFFGSQNASLQQCFKILQELND